MSLKYCSGCGTTQYGCLAAQVCMAPSFVCEEFHTRKAESLVEWRAEVNRLVTETFQIGRREWRWVNDKNGSFTVWADEPLIDWRSWRAETRLVPLDFCGSLDAVRQVEAAFGFDETCSWLEILARDFGDTAPLTSAEQRAVALLRWRGVAVPERPTGEQE